MTVLRGASWVPPGARIRALPRGLPAGAGVGRRSSWSGHLLPGDPVDGAAGTLGSLGNPPQDLGLGGACVVDPGGVARVEDLPDGVLERVVRMSVAARVAVRCHARILPPPKAPVKVKD